MMECQKGNQIDFIIIRNSQKNLITNSRSNGGISNNTDHKIVIANVILDGYKTRRSKTKAEPKIDTSGYDDVYRQNRYRSTTKRFEIPTRHDVQAKRVILVEQCMNVGAERKFREIQWPQTPGTVTVELDINAAADVDYRDEKCKKLKPIEKEIRKYKKEVRKYITVNEKNILHNQMKQLETTKDYSNWYYEVMQEMQNKNSEPL